MLKVAVTGGSGFIGRHVLQNLLKRPIEVIATYNRRPIENLSEAKWVKLDLDAVPTDMFSVLGEPDILIHLAWSELSDYRARTHLELELPRQKFFLTQLIESGLKNLFVTGTCFEYGLHEGSLDESIEPTPHLQYPQAKDALRRTIAPMCVEKSVHFGWLRLFYLFGNGQPERTLYSQFHNAVREGRAAFDMSQGDQKRDYLPIDVAAEMICNLSLQRRDMGIVNICAGQPTTVRHLVESWRAEMSTDIRLNLGHYPYPDWEPMSFWGSSVKLQSLLATD